MQPSELNSIIAQSFLLGVFLSIFLYHLILYIYNRRRSFLFYNLYTFFLILCFYIHPYNTLFGFALPQLAANERVWQYIQLFSGAGIVIFYLLFIARFIHDHWKPKFRKYLNTLAVLFALDLLLALLQVQIWGIDYYNWTFEGWSFASGMRILLSAVRGLFFWSSCAFLLTIILMYILARDRIVRILGLSSLMLIAGGMVFALLDYGISLGGNPLINYWIFQISSALQLMTFALLLGYRERKIELEKSHLASLEAAKSRFFADVSHEFRTPLTLILGPVSDLLKEDRLPAERDILQMVHKNARDLLRLINQILELSKLDSGTLSLKTIPENLVLFCRQIVTGFTSLAVSKKITLTFEADPEDIWFSFDPKHFEKIIVNLMSNALKYTPSGGTIYFSLQVVSSQRQLVIQVKDTGIGVQEDLLPHIFDRFYSADQADLTTDVPSTGIGLALTKELVELHGGKIRVESQLNRGTTFILTFPYGKLAAVSTASEKVIIQVAEAQPLVAAASLSMLTEKPLVLVIEDNEDMLLYIQNAIGSSYEIITANDGEAGVALALARIPDLIITDVMMPRKSGFTVTSELKNLEATSHIPIIILTGKSSHGSRLQGLEIDADAYLVKPFDTSELLIRIENLLRNRQRLQAYYSKHWLSESAPGEVTSREENFISKVLAIVDDNLDNEHFTIAALAKALLLDRSQLYRKLEAITGKSPSLFIRSYRLQHAKLLLEANTMTVTQIAYQVGFKDVAYFSRCFKEEFGYSPSQAKKRHGKSSH